MKDIIPVGQFKTHCYKMLDQSYKEHRTLTITKKGKAIAQIVPLNDNEKTSIFGMMQNIASINKNEDIISPIEVKWDAEE